MKKKGKASAFCIDCGKIVNGYEDAPMKYHWRPSLIRCDECHDLIKTVIEEWINRPHKEDDGDAPPPDIIVCSAKRYPILKRAIEES